MQEIALIKPIRDPEKQPSLSTTFPALIQLKPLTPKPNIQFKFK